MNLYMRMGEGLAGFSSMQFSELQLLVPLDEFYVLWKFYDNSIFKFYGTRL